MALAPEDLPLVAAAHAGDPAALDRLLRLCQPDVRRYAQRHCLISDIDDAVQETLLILSRKLGALRGLAALSGWLFRVVQRECRRLGRKTLNYDPYDEATLERWLAVHDDNALAIELRDALGSLPAHYREVILLREFEGYSYKEIADVIEAPIGTVMSRLSRARQSLKNRLSGQKLGDFF